jgi:PAS domain S-box-containing protein
MSITIDEKIYTEDIKINFKEVSVADQIIFDLLPDPCFLLFTANNEIIINHKLIRLFRFGTKQELINRLDIGYRFIEKDETARLIKDIGKIKESVILKPYRYKFIRNDDSRFDGEVSIKKLVHPQFKEIIGYHGTISELKNKELIQNGTGKSVYDLLNDTSDTLVINDFTGNILKANKKFFQINFFAERAIKKYSIFHMLAPECQQIYRERLEIIRTGNSVGPMEYRLVDDAGRPIYVEMTSQPIIYQSKKAILTRIRNISSQKEMEKKLFETILQTEEKEKQRFAMDLHDELGPFLSGIKLYIDEIELCRRNDSRRIELMNFLRKMVDEAIAKTKLISNSLMSHTLMDFGLAKALASFVQQMNIMHQIRIDLEIKNMTTTLNKTLEISIYRIMIELINNSLKHSEAKRIEICLYDENNSIKATYKDDGRGFDVEKEFETPGGIGLNSIVNRLQSIRASYNFSSKPNKGMQFWFHLPLN